MEKLIVRFTGLNIWVKVIIGFCLFGAFVNLFLVARDISSGGILLRLHAGFLVLYLAHDGAQVAQQPEKSTGMRSVGIMLLQTFYRFL